MKLPIPAIVLCCAVSAVHGQSGSASPMERYREAERRGKEDQLFSRCNATATAIDRFLIGPGLHPDVEHYHVTLSTSAGQIALLFAEAKRLYQKPLPDVPKPLLDDAVFVSADPHQPPSPPAPAAIEHIVLQSKRSGLAIQPLEFKGEPVEWGIAVGGRARPNRATARFEISRVRELPAGEFDIVLVTQDGERRCKVGGGDRERVFGGR